MDINMALRIVLELANDNALQAKDIIDLDPELLKQVEEQEQATELVAEFIIHEGLFPHGDTIFRFIKEDVDGNLDCYHDNITDDQREACYEAVSRIDCSPIFEQIEYVCQMALRDT
jgi:hypothetical protein